MVNTIFPHKPSVSWQRKQESTITGTQKKLTIKPRGGKHIEGLAASGRLEALSLMA